LIKPQEENNDKQKIPILFHNTF